MPLLCSPVIAPFDGFVMGNCEMLYPSFQNEERAYWVSATGDPTLIAAMSEEYAFNIMRKFGTDWLEAHGYVAIIVLGNSYIANLRAPKPLCGLYEITVPADPK